MPSIVTVNVTEQVGPTPLTLQGTGAIISQGGTTTAPGTLTLLTQLSSINAVLQAPHAVTSIVIVSTTATVTAASAHGYTIGDTLYVTIAGASISALNGVQLVTVTTTTAFTFVTAASGSVTGTITYLDSDTTGLTQRNATFFAQGSNLSVYVLELGPGNATDGANYLATWLTSNPWRIYSFLVPRSWDGNAAFLSLIAANENTTAKVYFWVTTTLATYSVYMALMKCVNALIENPATGVWSANALTAISWSGEVVTATTTTPHGVAVGQWFQIAGVTPTGYNGYFQAQTGTTGSTLVYNLATNPGAETILGTLEPSYWASSGIPSTEFSQAAPFFVSLNYAPSSSNKVGPLEFSFVYGVTPFSTSGNGSLLTTLKNANISVIGTGAEGGISNTMVLWGNMLDGNPFNYWYSVDYAQLNLDQAISNAVINGSNNPANPLYLDQAGITALEGVGASVFSNMVTFGLALGRVVQTQLTSAQFDAALDAGTYDGLCVINAIPFASYYSANPGDYKIGKYAGFTGAYTPLRGFDTIVFNLSAVSFPG
jgi:hypothetical protein